MAKTYKERCGKCGKVLEKDYLFEIKPSGAAIPVCSLFCAINTIIVPIAKKAKEEKRV